MDESPDPYATLGVSRDAEHVAIQSAYRLAARQYHPDVAGPGGDPMMRQLNAAWETLRDKHRRAAYDRAHPVRPPSLGGAAEQAYESHGSYGSQPAWHGSAGKPPGRPAGSIVTFGRFMGWSVGEVARVDPNWLDWFAHHPQGRQYAAEIAALTAPAPVYRAPAPKARRHFWSR
jgi:curved DNA-binding protein CbpA